MTWNAPRRSLAIASRFFCPTFAGVTTPNWRSWHWRAQEATIARWISAFGVLGDAEGFRRLGRSFAILDRSEVVVQQLLDGAGLGAEDAGPDMAANGAVSTVVRYWQELVRASYQEAHYWADRHTGASGLGLSEHPITLRRRLVPSRDQPFRNSCVSSWWLSTASDAPVIPGPAATAPTCPTARPPMLSPASVP